ncbi:MAG: hypothetical protein K2O69_00925, partial [Odoribacter sp.]|nr:hypothetical protein [Odoribacter sp.]
MRKQINQTIANTASDIAQTPMLIVDLNSGRYLKAHPAGHEALNLERNPVDGRFYGYCPPNDRINITRLGAKKSDNSISGVTIVYTRKKTGSSDREIIAFCENATVYRQGNDGKKLKRTITGDNGNKIPCSYSIESDTLIDLRAFEPKFNIHLADYNTYMFRMQRCFKGRYPELDEKIFAFIRHCISRTNIDDDFSFQEEIQQADLKKEAGQNDTSTVEPESLNSNNSLIVRKNSKVAKQALIHAEYKCAADSRHTTFTTAQGVPYMEGHHLI